MGSVCPERRSRPIYPESTTRGNEPNLSLLRLQASIIRELADVPIGIYYPSCDSIPTNLPHVPVYMALKEVPYVDVFHSRSNPLLSPASFSLPDLAEELSPSGLAVHAILLRINISIAMNASLLCMVRLLCQFPFRFFELMKIVGVCWKSHFSGLWSNFLGLASGQWESHLLGIRFLCHLFSCVPDIFPRERINILSA